MKKPIPDWVYILIGTAGFIVPVILTYVAIRSMYGERSAVFGMVAILSVIIVRNKLKHARWEEEQARKFIDKEQQENEDGDDE